MSAPVTQASHLERVELSSAGVHGILSQLGEWLPEARFEVDGKIEKCADMELDQRCRPLFVELGILKKVRSIPNLACYERSSTDCIQIRSQQTRMKYNVIRIQSKDSVEFYNSIGETDLIPIRVIEGNPTVSNAISDPIPNPSHPLEPGAIIHITKDVKISPALYCLVVVTY